MPKTLADARLKVTVMTTKPTAPEALTVTELTAGEDVECNVLKSDFRLSATGSDTIADTALCSEGNAVTFGASNYEGSMTPFRYLTSAGIADAAEDVAFDLLKEKGTILWIALREGPPYTQAWAAADEYELFEVVTDSPQRPSDTGGYIKRVVPLGVQRKWDGAVASA